jgi:hypothetical protein
MRLTLSEQAEKKKLKEDVREGAMRLIMGEGKKKRKGRPITKKVFDNRPILKGKSTMLSLCMAQRKLIEQNEQGIYDFLVSLPFAEQTIIARQMFFACDRDTKSMTSAWRPKPLKLIKSLLRLTNFEDPAHPEPEKEIPYSYELRLRCDKLIIDNDLFCERACNGEASPWTKAIS